MRLFLCVAALAAILLPPVATVAQENEQRIVFLRVPDSQKDTEIHLAKVLLEKLKVNSSLKMRSGNEEDLVIQAQFKANEDEQIPATVVLIDARILNRDPDGKPVSQVISIASYADIKPKPDKMPELLEWANRLNSQSIPLRVYVSGDKIVIGRNLLNSVTAPLSENAVVGAFSGVVRAWTSVMADLRKNDLIAE